MELKDIKIGSPYLFKSAIYGDTAVHATAIYGEIVHFTIDGGENSRQARDFPELSDGKYFALAGRLEKRTRHRTAKHLQPAQPSKRKRDASAERALAEAAGIINNTIREVRGVGKVAFVTSEETF